MIPPVLAAVYFGWPYFDALDAVLAVWMMAEWTRMVRKRPALFAVGSIYLLAGAAALWFLRNNFPDGEVLIFILFALVWGTDTGAYLVGSAIGGPKLAPAISPGKTISGAIGGLIIGAGCSLGVAFIFKQPALLPFLAMACGVSIASQAGDLLESWVKRIVGVKDSGSLIPGHGGILDRVDGLVAGALIMAAFHLAGFGDHLWTAP